MNYEIKGGSFPVACVNVPSGTSVRCQRGAMAWMSENMEMQTKGGGIGKMFGKMMTGESIFENIYTANGGDGMITFSSGVPGQILPVDVSGGKTIVAQKSSFLACDSDVSMDIFFQKKFGTGVFGGEGFIMQKFSGNGVVLIQAGGTLIEYTLEPGQTMVVQTGTLCCMEDTVKMDIVSVKGIGNMLAGGEGFFNTKLTGPGKIWLQTMSLGELAGALAPYIPTK